MFPAPAAPDQSRLVRVRLFAGLREATGWSERLVHAADSPVTPLRLWQQLQLDRAWAAACAAASGGGDSAAAPDAPAVAEVLPQGVRVAINQAFAAADTPLADGDELAFLPPISGG